ncbi:hypothetical protein [Riemerella anatipestifer]|uniref:hypothetical protein n=1 Tax=Riemerella anatipestifer TaxID=34085 RepID=UPI00129EBFE9|nr:hypothetical protein [Riemerella anatipestifer]MRM83149.1 hypothetical protein [Riemerella anatipestifer]
MANKNNARRSTEILSLIIVFLWLGNSCGSNKKSPLSEIYTNVIWRLDSLKTPDNYDSNEILPLSEVRKLFYIKGGKLFNKENNTIVSNISLLLRINKNLTGMDVKIKNGLPYEAYCDFSNGIMCRKDIFYDSKGNIVFYSVENYTAIFKKGCGYWKDFYNEGHLKEEGEVKNNYKVGQWKYYNKNGEIDSLKVYSEKDSVDVRFPHCIFNKKEPCY